MSVGYKLVQWTRPKWVYDAVVIAGIVTYILLFQAVSARDAPDLSPTVVTFRAWGSCGLLLLTFILAIGPLARLDRRFLPLLYNRRHAGVLMFGVAAWHASGVLGFHHAYSDTTELVSLLTYDAAITPTSLPFQLFGAAALTILFFMAATSHDFWQKNLGPLVWKGLHMAVYAAYALVICHVAFGVLAWETHPGLTALVAAGAVGVALLHVLAARRSADDALSETMPNGHIEGDWLDAGPVDSLADGRARALSPPSGERIAVVRDGDRISAVHGVCAHQGGPLYEGKVLDGCLTCPWHGWNYRPTDGCSPPPFEERIPTYRVRVQAGRVWVDPTPLPPGTPVEPALAAATAPDPAPFFVGYLPFPRPLRSAAVGAALAFLLTMAGVAAAAASWQRPPGDATLTRGQEITGILEMKPYGRVRYRGEDGAVHHALLVAKGKFGTPEKFAALDGSPVVAKGLLLTRDGRQMIELSGLDAAADFDADEAAALHGLAPEALGRVTVSGEIVDSKCYLGRMRPGGGRGHRACAQLCIAGGIPPVLVAEDTEGGATHYLLVGPDGGPVGDAVLPFAAEPVTVTGALSREGDSLVLQVDPAEIARR